MTVFERIEKCGLVGERMSLLDKVCFVVWDLNFQERNVPIVQGSTTPSIFSGHFPGGDIQTIPDQPLSL